MIPVPGYGLLAEGVVIPLMKPDNRLLANTSDTMPWNKAGGLESVNGINNCQPSSTRGKAINTSDQSMIQFSSQSNRNTNEIYRPSSCGESNCRDLRLNPPVPRHPPYK